MPFEPEKIARHHVLDAVQLIERQNIRLVPSIGYDVIINHNRFPPKEIIRISHELATGNSPGQIYGGHQVNKVLKSLGFEIKEKIKVWKLGCNWETGNPSFYEFIKSRKIILGYYDRMFKRGDLVLITEGFTVYAIAKLLEEPKAVTLNRDFSEAFKKYSIPYIEEVQFAEAEWYELPKTEVFAYHLQAGIRQVRKQEIRDKAINLWESREFLKTDINFYVIDESERISKKWNYPTLLLIHINWSDSGFQTSFKLLYYKSYEEFVEIGIVKVLDKGKLVSLLPKSFDKLSDNFCSLGQTLKFYSRLYEQLPQAFFRILKSLNDCAFYDEYKRNFENDEGFKISLIKSSEAYLALSDAKVAIRTNIENKDYQFSFHYRLPNALEAHQIQFEFYLDLDLKNRFFCIIGKNGTGKTKLISQLANKLTDIEEEGMFIPERPSFSKIIATSFSYFDKFRFPRANDISYEFIGIKDRKGLISESRISNILWEAYQEITKDREKRDLWRDSIKSSLETEYLDFNFDELDSLSTRQEFIEKSEEIFSSGQKIIFQFITRLIAVIEYNSLIIFDEPETHLHPNIAGRLLRAIHLILEFYKSYCILATHSPIVVQEVPSKYIRIFDRQGNIPVIYKPTIECFGENLSNISNSIFHADEEKELYKSVLDKLAEVKNLEEIEEIFDYRLSLNARLYIQTVKND